MFGLPVSAASNRLARVVEIFKILGFKGYNWNALYLFPNNWFKNFASIMVD